MRAVGSEHRAASRIEQRVVFEKTHSFAHRVERAAACGQHALACCEDVVQARVVALLCVWIHLRAQDRARATVNGNDCGRIHRFGFLLGRGVRDVRGLLAEPFDEPGVDGLLSPDGVLVSHGNTNSVMSAAAFAERLVRYATASQSASITASTAASEFAASRRSERTHSVRSANCPSGELTLSVRASTRAPRLAARRASWIVSST